MLNKIKTVLKFIFAFGLIFYLMKSGKISFALFEKTLDRPMIVIISIIIFIVNLALAAYRWLSMVRLKTQRKIPFFAIMKLNWIGNFFSTILPGAVTGDLVKIVYARKFDPELTKTYLITSVFFDRILGLCGLILLMGLSTLSYYNQLINLSDNMKRLIHFNSLFFIGMILFLISIFLPAKIQDKLLALSNKLPLLGQHVSQTLSQIWHIGCQKKMIIKLIFLSMFIQILNVFAFWILTNSFIQYQENHTLIMKFTHAFIFFPIGLISTVIPITPGGLGIGHLLFDKLFANFQVINGADLFNIYFILTVMVNLLGVIPYLFKNQINVDSDYLETSDNLGANNKEISLTP